MKKFKKILEKLVFRTLNNINWSGPFLIMGLEDLPELTDDQLREEWLPVVEIAKFGVRKEYILGFVVGHQKGSFVFYSSEATRKEDGLLYVHHTRISNFDHVLESDIHDYISLKLY